MISDAFTLFGFSFCAPIPLLDSGWMFLMFVWVIRVSGFDRFF